MIGGRRDVVMARRGDEVSRVCQSRANSNEVEATATRYERNTCGLNSGYSDGDGRLQRLGR